MSIHEFVGRAEKYREKKEEVKEIDIEDVYVNYAKGKRCKAFKLVFLNRKGWPDRTTCCPHGRIFFIEFKKKGEPLKPIQVKIRKIIVELGFEYYVCDEVGQAERHLDRFLKKAKSMAPS